MSRRVWIFGTKLDIFGLQTLYYKIRHCLEISNKKDLILDIILIIREIVRKASKFRPIKCNISQDKLGKSTEMINQICLDSVQKLIV